MQAKLTIKKNIDETKGVDYTAIKTVGDDATCAALLVDAVLDTLSKLGFTPEQFASVLCGSADDVDEGDDGDEQD